MQHENVLNPEQVDSYAYQAARFQDLNEANGLPLEGELNIPRMLLGAFGPANARLITERMVEIRKDPIERERAEATASELYKQLQARHGISS